MLLYIVLGVYSLIIFPIFITTNFILVLKNKNLYFSIKIFGLNVIGGLVTVDKKGFVIKIGSKKIIKYPYKKLLKLRSQSKTLKDFHILSFNSLVEYGNKNSIDIANVIAHVYVWHNNEFCRYLTYKKPYIQICNNVDLYNDKNMLNVYVQAKIAFNILSILIILVKKIKEKISNAVKR